MKLAFRLLLFALVGPASCIETDKSLSSINIHPKVSRPPVDTWGYTDIFYGLIMGGFGPFTALSRGEDCFSSWYIWGVSTIEIADFFGKSFDIRDTSDWAKLGVKLQLYGIESYTLVTVCIDELKVNKANPWH